jgi:hypothetical protein
VYIKVYNSNFILIIFASSAHQIYFTNHGSTNVYTPPYGTKAIHPTASCRISTSNRSCCSTLLQKLHNVEELQFLRLVPLLLLPVLKATALMTCALGIQ